MKTEERKNNKLEWNKYEEIDSKFKNTIFVVQKLFDNNFKLFCTKNNAESAKWYSNAKNDFKKIIKCSDLNSPLVLIKILDIYKKVLVRSVYYKKINSIVSYGDGLDRIA